MMTRSWIIYKKNDVQSNQKIKYDFMSVFLCWIKMYIEQQDHSLAMIDFV